MRHLLNVFNSTESSKLRAESYQPLSNLFFGFRDIIPLDTDVDLNFDAGSLFISNYAAHTISVAQDILHIVSTVNANGANYFSNQERQIWRKTLDRLPYVQTEAENLNRWLNDDNWANWRRAVVGNDLDAVRPGDIHVIMPGEVWRSEISKKYVYEFFRDYRNHQVNKDMLEELARKLELHPQN